MPHAFVNKNPATWTSHSAFQSWVGGVGRWKNGNGVKALQAKGDRHLDFFVADRGNTRPAVPLSSREEA